MRKNFMTNKGIPLYVDYKEDLAAKPKSSMDSWYVISNFECEGQQLGFMWHQQSFNAGPAGRMVTAEFLLMNGNENIWINNDITEPESEKNGTDAEKMHVYSSLGVLSGDHNKMTLKLEVADGNLDVVLTPKKEVLYNGTTGLLNFMGTDSLQFSFPNMSIEGTFTIKGKEHKIKNATAWLDRQWSHRLDAESFAPDASGVVPPSWLWLGMTFNDDNSGAISLWDNYSNDGRYTFANIINKNGTQVNVIPDVTYDEIWTSSKTGRHYAKVVNISIPTEDLNLKLVAMIDEPEFIHEDVQITGCQSLCSVTGVYKGEPINRHVVLEMIGDICGEEY